MGLKDLLDFFHQYGPAGVVIAVLLFVIGALYLQNTKNYKERLEEANKRADEANKRSERFELEVKALNDEIHRYMLLSLATKNVMGDAANEIRRLQ